MLKRLAVTGAVVAVLAFTIGQVAPVGAERRYERVTFRLAELAGDNDRALIDVGAPGVGLGDYFVFFNPIYNRALTKRVGQANGDCLIIEVAGTAPAVVQCDLTYELRDGDVTVEGPFDLAAADNEFAVTGGTDAYDTAHGELELEQGDRGLLFTFELLL